MPVAIVTGGSKGLGRALCARLLQAKWSVVTDARDDGLLARASAELRARAPGGTALVALPGDVAEQAHRHALVEAARRLGNLALLVNSASSLGPTPLRALGALESEDMRSIYEVNVIAPFALIKEALGELRAASWAGVMNISSDAAVCPYGTWGAYGSSKAALDQLSAVLAIEEPGLHVWAVDPGDMWTDLKLAASPDEDVGALATPESVAARLIGLVGSTRESGRVLADELEVEPVQRR